MNKDSTAKGMVACTNELPLRNVVFAIKLEPIVDGENVLGTETLNVWSKTFLIKFACHEGTGAVPASESVVTAALGIMLPASRDIKDFAQDYAHTVRKSQWNATWQCALARRIGREGSVPSKRLSSSGVQRVFLSPFTLGTFLPLELFVPPNKLD